MFKKNHIFSNILSQVPALLDPDEEDREDEFWEADIPKKFPVDLMMEVMPQVIELLPEDYYRWPHASGWEGSLRLHFWNRGDIDKNVLIVFEKEPRVYRDSNEVVRYYLHWHNFVSKEPKEMRHNPSGFKHNPSPELLAQALLWLENKEEKVSGTDESAT